MNKYLFLDIDGVLNSERTNLAYNCIVHSGIIKHRLITNIQPLNSFFDPIAVMLLKQAQLQMDFKIVISSSWRYTLGIKDFNIMFAEYDWDTTNIIVGRTGYENGIRGNQIQKWLDTNCTEPYEYAILDDSSDMLESQMQRFVKTSAYNGLDYEAYCKLLELFGSSINDTRTI